MCVYKEESQFLRRCLSSSDDFLATISRPRLCRSEDARRLLSGKPGPSNLRAVSQSLSVPRGTYEILISLITALLINGPRELSDNVFLVSVDEDTVTV